MPHVPPIEFLLFSYVFIESIIPIRHYSRRRSCHPISIRFHRNVRHIRRAVRKFDHFSLLRYDPLDKEGTKQDGDNDRVIRKIENRCSTSENETNDDARVVVAFARSSIVQYSCRDSHNTRLFSLIRILAFSSLEFLCWCDTFSSRDRFHLVPTAQWNPCL